jgi:exodeoxyribonuclease X
VDNPIKTIDFETTGVDAKTCKPLEVATFDGTTEIEWLIYCEEVPPETSAVHHITAEDLVKAASWEIVKKALASMCASEPLTILVAHNAAYEKDVIGEGFPPVLWLCTYKAALRIWPNAPAHKNEVLRYWLHLGDDRGRQGLQKPHSALHDAKVTWLILQELLKYTTLEEMIKWTEEPAKLPKMPMGKHYGQTWDTIPGPYLTWITNQTEMREDVKWCASQELARRKSQYATHRSS